MSNEVQSATETVPGVLQNENIQMALKFLKEKLVWGLKKLNYRPLRPKINDVTCPKPLLGRSWWKSLKKE